MLEELRNRGFEIVSQDNEGRTFWRVEADGGFSILLEPRGEHWFAHGDYGWEARNNPGQLRAFNEYTPDDLIVVDCSDASLLVDFRRGETWEDIDDEELYRRAMYYSRFYGKCIIEEALEYYSINSEGIVS